ncbi:MAG: CHAD domain-containing protein [Verrucomicrobiota bacterium]|nr:CHAD domain-containing protein [Verrucomicrobiota bacterium]
MSNALSINETSGDALFRLIRKQAQRALEVAIGERDTNDSPVHATRKHLKKARSALWLLQAELGKARHKRLDHILRDVGRLVSDVRDAEVRLDTVRELERIAHSSGGFRKLEELFVLELENFVSAFAGWHKEARPLLENFLAAFDEKHGVDFDDAKLECALQTSYKCARKAFVAAAETPTAECFHEFRSMAKRLMYQLRLLRPAQPVVICNLADELKKMADLLGRAHDFSFLGERVQQMDGSDETRHEVLAVIHAGEDECQRSAAQLSDRFFAERPRAFGRRVAHWLEEWREGKAPLLADAIFERA